MWAQFWSTDDKQHLVRTSFTLSELELSSEGSFIDLKCFFLMCFSVMKDYTITLLNWLLIKSLELEVNFQKLLLIIWRNNHAAFLLRWDRDGDVLGGSQDTQHNYDFLNHESILKHIGQFNNINISYCNTVWDQNNHSNAVEAILRRGSTISEH